MKTYGGSFLVLVLYQILTHRNIYVVYLFHTQHLIVFMASILCQNISKKYFTDKSKPWPYSNLIVFFVYTLMPCLWDTDVILYTKSRSLLPIAMHVPISPILATSTLIDLENTCQFTHHWTGFCLHLKHNTRKSGVNENLSVILSPTHPDSSNRLRGSHIRHGS